MKRGNTEHSRHKLISLVTRDKLDSLIGSAHRPWAMNRREAEMFVINHWDSDVELAVKQVFERMIIKAKG